MITQSYEEAETGLLDWEREEEDTTVPEKSEGRGKRQKINRIHPNYVNYTLSSTIDDDTGTEQPLSASLFDGNT